MFGLDDDPICGVQRYSFSIPLPFAIMLFMKTYFLKRLALLPLTLFFILLLNFCFIQTAPGGPVEQMMRKAEQASGVGNMARLSAGSDTMAGGAGAYMIEDRYRAELEKQFGFDKPLYVRFFKMLKDYLSFDFGKSFYKNKSVLQLIKEKLPVSISLGLFSTLLIYLVAIPLGVRKAVKDGTTFDFASSLFVYVVYAIPSFLLALFFILLFCGGQFWSVFPLRGLVSDNFADLSVGGKILDYLWHICLPVLTLALGGIASLTLLTKNAFLEEIHKRYVTVLRAKGLSYRKILYGHVFKNAMLIVIAGFPTVLIGMLLSGSLLLEVMFSLDGIGLLGFESVLTRDYPVIFGTLYLFSLLGLLLNIVSDLIYSLVDPRIDFSCQNASSAGKLAKT